MYVRAVYLCPKLSPGLVPPHFYKGGISCILIFHIIHNTCTLYCVYIHVHKSIIILHAHVYVPCFVYTYLQGFPLNGKGVKNSLN